MVGLCEYGMTAAAIVPKLLVVAAISLLVSTVGIALIVRLVLFGDSSVGCPSSTTTTTLASSSLVSSEQQLSGVGCTRCSSLLPRTTPSSDYSSLQEGENGVVTIARQLSSFTSSSASNHRHNRGKVIGTNFNAADVSSCIICAHPKSTPK